MNIGIGDMQRRQIAIFPLVLWHFIDTIAFCVNFCFCSMMRKEENVENWFSRLENWQEIWRFFEKCDFFPGKILIWFGQSRFVDFSKNRWKKILGKSHLFGKSWIIPRGPKKIAENHSIPKLAPASKRNDPHSHAMCRGRGSAQTIKVNNASSPLRTDTECDVVRNICGAPTDKTQREKNMVKNVRFTN